MEPSATALEEVLRRWLYRDDAETDLADYFGEPHHVARSNSVYSGRYFERLGGGGDQPDVSDRFTAADLLAVQMLSVDVPPESIIEILHGRLGRTLSRHLHEIPTDVSLGDPEASEHLDHDSPADRAWQLLKSELGVGYVTAGKLMARKRPHLIPVYDDVVRCALDTPEELWLWMHAVMADPETGIRERLAELRSTGCVPVEVGELRVLDVVIWKGHRRKHKHQSCPAPGTSGLAG